MSTPVTRGELHEALDTWGGALLARIESGERRLLARIESGEQRLSERIDRLRDELQVDLARQAGALQEWMATMIATIDDKYKDLPDRVRCLESRVFGRNGADH